MKGGLKHWLRLGGVVGVLVGAGCTPRPSRVDLVQLQACEDLDGDGTTFGSCVREDHPNFGAPRDCNDHPDRRGAEETPGKPEIPYDGLDNDCSFEVDGEHDRIDADRDGFPGLSRAEWEALGTRHAGYWPVYLPGDDASVDCNDDPDRGGAEQAPGRPEIPDGGIDQDCDGFDAVGGEGDTGGAP